MPLLSVLDLAPVAQGSNPGQALRNSRDLAQHAERLGYERFWLAEHHNMPGIASAAAARALRRTLVGGEERFPQEVAELMAYLDQPAEGQAVIATPGAGTRVPIYILGSSTFGAQLAAYMGLPFAFASHFAPQALELALAYYRDGFRPSAQLDKPYVMLGVNACAAETDEEALYLFSSTQQAFVNLRTGRPGLLPPPVEGYAERLDPAHQAILAGVLSEAAVGGPETIRKRLTRFAERHGADELILTTQVFDHAKRVRSFEVVAEAMGLGPS
jgi:luciferase family oxidoreductase group 1